MFYLDTFSRPKDALTADDLVVGESYTAYVVENGVPEVFVHFEYKGPTSDENKIYVKRRGQELETILNLVSLGLVTQNKKWSNSRYTLRAKQ